MHANKLRNTLRLKKFRLNLTKKQRKTPKKNIGQPEKIDRCSHFVARRGIEPLIPP